MKQFINSIANSNLYKVNDVKKGVIPLTKKQKERALLFLKKLLENNNKNLIICLRGDNYNHLSIKLFNDENERASNVFSSEFYRRCFMLGDKSKMNYLCSYNTGNPLPWAIDISKADDQDFVYIFNHLTRLVLNNHSGWSSLNPDIKTFFTDNNNKVIFLEKVRNLTSAEKLLVRDYYCRLLHTEGDKRYSPYSYFVSATVERDISESYADEIDPIAFLYFVPEPINKLASNYETILAAKPLLKASQLPFVNTEIHPDEFEISLKGGLFPHFIVGIYEYNNHRFVFNHNIFKKANKSNSSIFNQGIRIDQSDFFIYLEKTNYEKGFGLMPDGTYVTLAR